MKPIKSKEWINECENLGILRRVKDNQMMLSMENGGFSKEDLWFLHDEDGEEYVVFPQKLFLQLLRRIKDMQEERLVMMLEKDLIGQMPIDFEDVMAVARDMLESKRQSDGHLPDIDTAKFAKDIKKKHPNLFFDIDYLRKAQMTKL